MPEIASLSYTPRLSQLAAVSQNWVWFPLHEGAGLQLRDRAGEIGSNGGGRTSPILSGAAATLTGTAVGQEWALDPTGFTAQGGLAARVDSNLTAFFDFASLVDSAGMMIIAFNMRRLGVAPSVNQWLFDATAGGGGVGIFVTPSRSLVVAYVAAGSKTLKWVVCTPTSGAYSITDSAAHTVCIVFDFSVNLGTCTLFVDAVPVARDAAMLRNGPFPVLQNSKPITFFGPQASGARLGTGGAYVALSNLVFVRCPYRLTYSRVAQFVRDQAAFPQDMSVAIL